MLEAVDRLRDTGHRRRLHAHPGIPLRRTGQARSSMRIERCFVVEQNRDAQLRSLLAIETGIAARRDDVGARLRRDAAHRDGSS